MRAFIILCMLLTVGSAHADERRGPGSPVEAGFKAYVIKLAENLTHTPAQLKVYFKHFNADDVYVAAQNIKPKCSNDKSELVTMRINSHLAYVFGKEPNIITLDCGDYYDASVIPPRWKEIFEGDTLENKMFALHELLRIMGVNDEDAYNGSSELSLVALKQNDLETEQIKNMSITITDAWNQLTQVGLLKSSPLPNPACKLEIIDNVFHNAESLTLEVNNIIRVRYVSSPVVGAILLPTSKGLVIELMNSSRRKDSIVWNLIEKMRILNCFVY